MAKRERKPVHHVQMTDGKRAIIQQLLQEYDIQDAKDIQDALKDLLIILGYFEPPVRVFGATVPEKGSHEFRCSRATFVPCL